MSVYREDLIKKSSLFKEIFEYIESRRAIIEEKILSEISEYRDEIGEIADYIVSGGKRLRGVLTMLVAEALNGSIENTLDAAIAIEMVHSASLALDDIIDGDLLRRGKPSSWVKYGISQTVLVSNFLIPKAQLMIKRYGFEALLNVIQAWLHATLGEILDVFGELKLLPSQYEKIINLKTASVFKMAAYLGSKAANASENYVKIATEYGELLGILYQVVDDLTDVLSGDAEKLNSRSIKLFLSWLNVGDAPDLNEVLNKASERIIEFIEMISRKASLFPESKYKKIIMVFPVVTVYALLSEAGERGVKYFYEKIYSKIAYEYDTYFRE